MVNMVNAVTAKLALSLYVSMLTLILTAQHDRAVGSLDII